MTQAELAERLGVTRQTVIAIEQGRYSPSLEMAFQIARVFGVPLDEVFQYPDRRGDGDHGAAVYERYGAPEVVRIAGARGTRDSGQARCWCGSRRRWSARPRAPRAAAAPGSRDCTSASGSRGSRSSEPISPGPSRASGEGVTRFAPGDLVFGSAGTAFGAHAEFVTRLRAARHRARSRAVSTRPRRSRRSTDSSPRCRSSATWRTCRPGQTRARERGIRNRGHRGGAAREAPRCDRRRRVQRGPRDARGVARRRSRRSTTRARTSLRHGARTTSSSTRSARARSGSAARR